MTTAGSNVCRRCGTQLAPDLLACPGCATLVHADRLNELAAEAQHAQAAGALTTAASLWREAMDLLPPQSTQYQLVASRTAEISRLIESSPQQNIPPAASSRPAPASSWGKAAAGAGVVALMLWKLKFILVFILTKGKLLLLGLTNASTALSMLLSMGVYWSIWGWKFAAGLVVSIYIHEMGHVAVMRKFGFRASSPMFIPGLGALIRMRQHPVSGQEDARIGLAGPIWGMAAAMVAAGIWLATREPYWGAIAHVGAWINLFNLLPLYPLDGGRGFRALSRKQAWLCVLAIGIAWFVSHESLLVLLLIVGIFNALAKSPTAPADRVAAVQYILLLAILTAMSRLPIRIDAEDRPTTAPAQVATSR